MPVAHCIASCTVFAPLFWISSAVITVTFAGSVLASTGASGRRVLETTTSRVSITSSDWAWVVEAMRQDNRTTQTENPVRCIRTETSLRLEGSSRNVRRMGLLTCGSSLPCAFPYALAHSGNRAELLPAYSGGTVMDLHH